MNRQTLADVLQSTSQTGSYTLATVLEGVEAGSQLLLRDGDDLWQTQSTGLLQRQLSAPAGLYCHRLSYAGRSAGIC